MNIVSSIYSVQALDVVLPLIYQLRELGIARTVTFVLKFAASMETPSVQFLFSCIAEVSNDILIIGDSELYREAESVFIQKGVRYKKVPTLNDQNTLDNILAGIQSKTIMLRSHADIDQDSLSLGNAIRAKGGKVFVFLEGPYPPHHSLPLKYFSYARPDAADIFLISHRSHSEDLKTVGYRKFSAIGYPKLYPAWRDLIANSAEFKELKQQNSYQVSVFTRGEEKGRDPQIIDNQTLRSILIDIIDEISLLKDNAKILIKPHPLQDARIIENLIVDKKNVTITYNHPSLLAAASDLVITTWSSTIVDGLVFNVPSIEYFIENEGFRSIYPQGSSFRKMGILHAHDAQSFKCCLEMANNPSYKPKDIVEKMEHKMDLSIFNQFNKNSVIEVKSSKPADSKTLVSCPHCKKELYVDREGKWECPCCKNEFIYTSDYTSANGERASDHAFDCSASASGYGIINVFDTTICDNNLGNEIIMESVNRELRTIFPYDFFIKLPYLDSIGKEAERYLESGKHTFLGGTNALSAKMEEYRQWGLDETNVQFIKDVVLFGVGWWQYQDEISSYTRKILTQVLHKELLHSVRDTYTKKQLNSIGIDNVIVTGCPTLWKLTEDKCNRIPQKKSDNVLLTFTNYNQDKSDFLLADILLKQYKKIFVWPQGPEDYHYAKSISSQFEVLCPSLEELDDLLTSSYDLDYVGTRLHAGIRALENVRRAIIIGIDNRSLEKSKDFNLPVLKRSDLDLLPDKINSSFKTIIKVPFDNIRMWREQFEDGGSDKRVRSKYKNIGYDHRQRANTYLSHKDYSAMKPISRLFGFDRGQPIDRYYIDDFLRRNGSYIRGRVLEIADNGYTCKFGSDVTKSDVLNVVPSPDATIVGDLATGNNIPEAAFDCIILTQTINVIFDVKSTLKNAIKALKPGGTLLLTAPGISQISRFDMDRWGDYWRFTNKSLKMLLSEVVLEESIQVESFGNVAVAKAFLDGLALHELSKEVLDYRDEDYQVLLTCRVNKPIFESAGKSTVLAVQENVVSFQTPLVLLYHRVANDPVDAQLLAVSPENFEAHLKELVKNYRILPLCELIREIGNGGLRPDTVAITFDDGYLDNLTNAVPVLEKCGLHATVFVTSGMVGSQKEFWWDAMERVFLLGNGLPKMLSIYDSDSKAPREWDLSTAQNRLMAYDELCAIVSSQPANEKVEFVDNLISWAGLAPAPRESHRILDPDQLTKLAASSSIEIGSHTVSHARLSELEPEQQRQEIRRSKEQLEAIIKKPVRLISYPFGLSTDFTKETSKIIFDAGYEAGIANIQGNIVEPVDLYSIPRRLVRNWTGETFASWLKEEDKDRLEFETLSGRAQHLIDVQSK